MIAASAQVVVVEPRLSFDLGNELNGSTIPESIDSILIPEGVNILNFLNTHHASFSTITPTRPEHTFLGWYMDAEFTLPLTEETLMPATSIALFARWQQTGISTWVGAARGNNRSPGRNRG